MLLRILGFSAAHFVVSMVASFLTYGHDLDQLRSRSALSRAAGVVHDVLWYPHDVLLRVLPPGAILRPGVIPAVLWGSSVVWGVVLYGLWRAYRGWRSAGERGAGTRRG